jgi:hypothetical protein
MALSMEVVCMGGAIVELACWVFCPEAQAVKAIVDITRERGINLFVMCQSMFL